MPELPEVETIRRGLQEKIVGKKITDLSFDWLKSFQGDSADVIGKKVVSVQRRAKTIQVELIDDTNLLFHLKMTGQLIYRDALAIKSNEKSGDFFAGGHPDHDWHLPLPNKHTRIVFTFEDDSKLFFNDLRKFGWCKVLSGRELMAIHDEKYGLEPFAKEFNVEYLIKFAKKYPNRKIKQFLLDQTIIAGIGNIYADEALFAAKISPYRLARDIDESEWAELIKVIVEILDLAIKKGGTTDSDYVNVEGKKGGMQDFLKVYHKEGEPCANKCGDFVHRTTIAGRGTHYCPTCQK
ncbi:MAG: bifunctional DNA-formamidopyrimidine glycosylase/DNA-(apurinic or apyrimidinic site) lyase [Candidatus Berkelbacteria bacterium]